MEKGDTLIESTYDAWHSLNILQACEQMFLPYPWAENWDYYYYEMSCPTLCDPTDGSPPGSPIPGILQARTLEWVAITLIGKG